MRVMISNKGVSSKNDGRGVERDNHLMNHVIARGRYYGRNHIIHINKNEL